MRTELQRVQKESGITMIFVTHDQGEALALADRIVVMLDGRIEQIGTPEQIYNTPVSAFVADFVGFENVFPLENGKLRTPQGLFAPQSPVPNGVAGLAWRPTGVHLGTGDFQGTVRGTSFAGRTREYLLDSPLGTIKAEADAGIPPYEIGTAVPFGLPVENAALLSRFG
jgi:putative spermidine/putrescine transport system ATP-binding protein